MTKYDVKVGRVHYYGRGGPFLAGGVPPGEVIFGKPVEEQFGIFQRDRIDPYKDGDGDKKCEAWGGDDNQVGIAHNAFPYVTGPGDRHILVLQNGLSALNLGIIQHVRELTNGFAGQFGEAMAVAAEIGKEEGYEEVIGALGKKPVVRTGKPIHGQVTFRKRINPGQPLESVSSDEVMGAYPGDNQINGDMLHLQDGGNELGIDVMLDVKKKMSGLRMADYVNMGTLRVLSNGTLVGDLIRPMEYLWRDMAAVVEFNNAMDESFDKIGGSVPDEYRGGSFSTTWRQFENEDGQVVRGETLEAGSIVRVGPKGNGGPQQLRQEPNLLPRWTLDKYVPGFREAFLEGNQKLARAIFDQIGSRYSNRKTQCQI